MLCKVAQSPINRPIWSHCLPSVPPFILLSLLSLSFNKFLKYIRSCVPSFASFLSACWSWLYSLPSSFFLSLIFRPFCTTLLPVWPDLAKFCHFDKKCKVFGNLFERLFSIGQILSLLWQIICSIGHILIVLNGQILNKLFNHLVTLPPAAPASAPAG